MLTMIGKSTVNIDLPHKTYMCVLEHRSGMEVENAEGSILLRIHRAGGRGTFEWSLRPQNLVAALTEFGMSEKDPDAGEALAAELDEAAARIRAATRFKP